MSLFELRFSPREPPLVAVAAAIPRARAGPLVEAWRKDGTALESLRALATPSMLLLFGEAERLPWADGVAYLGRDPEAPRLLVPTALVPDLPYALVERALFARRPEALAPAVLLVDPLRLIDAAAPLAFDVPSIDRWLAGSRA